MSLSFWIRDYVFVPLAAAYPVRWWRFAALFLSMVTFGLWHGATVLFVLWGAYHGVLLVGHRQWQQWPRRHAENWDNAAARFAAWAVTFGLISLGWLFFRANNTAQVVAMFGALVAPASYLHLALRPNCYFITVVIIAGYFTIAGVRSLATRFESAAMSRLWWLASPAVYAVIVTMILVWSKQKTEFVYLQF
jgi:alginate O-acetyltransferase complex protein AlgI